MYLNKIVESQLVVLEKNIFNIVNVIQLTFES